MRKLLFARLITVSLLIPLFLSGCKHTDTANEPQVSPVPTQPASSSPSGQPTASPAPSPIQVGQDSYETGKPKEEPVVPDTGGPAKQSKLVPVYSVSKGNVAISFDDGPTKYTGELLKVLRENQVKATFFFLGQNAAAYPQTVTEAVYEGHQIGYHSNSHPRMTNMPLKAQEQEFDLGLGKLKKLDSNPITLFRPPYGAYNNDTKLVTEEHHISMVLWNEDPRDWSLSDPAQIAQSVLSQVHSGSIIVLHDRPSTISALPAIISGIRKKGLKLVVIQ